MGIGAQIKSYRKQAKMTQPELADRLGVHETTIRRWEQEKDRGPDGKTLNAIAEVFHIPLEQLLNSSSEEIDKSLEADKKKENLVYEWGGGHKLVLPNTPETRQMFQQIVLLSMNTPATASAMP